MGRADRGGTGQDPRCAVTSIPGSGTGSMPECDLVGTTTLRARLAQHPRPHQRSAGSIDHRPGKPRAPTGSRERNVMTTSYYAPTGGLPGQTELTTNRAMFTEAYAVLPRGTMTDIVTSFLPFWEKTRLWVIARPLSGFAETFSQYIVEVLPGGGSDSPEADPDAEGVLFLMEGDLCVTLDGEKHDMVAGGYAFIPPGAD